MSRVSRYNADPTNVSNSAVVAFLLGAVGSALWLIGGTLSIGVARTSFFLGVVWTAAAIVIAVVAAIAPRR